VPGRGGRGGRGGGLGGGLPGLSAPGGRIMISAGNGVTLSKEPSALTALAVGNDALATAARTVVAKLNWTGKPVPAGPVVPPLTPVFERMAAEYFHCQPLVVTARLKLPVRVEIDKPDEVGADRIANAAAVYVKFGGPAIVVDIGTATTFDVVSRDGAYIGGVIMPGPETAMSSLARRAARLFEVRFEPPDRVVGKSTAGALKSGLFHGLVGQVDYLIEKIIAECGFDGCTVIATGGLAAGIEKHSRYIKQYDPNLTLEGLRLIAEGN